jgi:hypothetical protein
LTFKSLCCSSSVSAPIEKGSTFVIDFQVPQAGNPEYKVRSCEFGDSPPGVLSGDLIHGVLSGDSTHGVLSGDSTHGVLFGDSTCKVFSCDSTCDSALFASKILIFVVPALGTRTNENEHPGRVFLVDN